MRPLYLIASATPGGFSIPGVLDQYLTPTDAQLAVELYAGTTGSYTVQYSPDDPFATYAVDYNTNANWYNHPTLVNLAADGVDTVTSPCRAVRLKTTTAATAPTSPPRLVVNQAGAR